jgi:hypothetical protein
MVWVKQKTRNMVGRAYLYRFFFLYMARESSSQQPWYLEKLEGQSWYITMVPNQTHYLTRKRQIFQTIMYKLVSISLKYNNIFHLIFILSSNLFVY